MLDDRKAIVRSKACYGGRPAPLSRGGRIPPLRGRKVNAVHREREDERLTEHDPRAHSVVLLFDNLFSFPLHISISPPVHLFLVQFLQLDLTALSLLVRYRRERVANRILRDVLEFNRSLV